MTTSMYDAPVADLGESIPDHPDRLFSHRGRLGVLRTNARNTLYLLAMLLPAAIAAIGFDSWLNHSDGLLQTANPMVPVILLGIAALLFIPLLWGSFVLGVRRLHDCGYSGWLLLLGLVPIIGSLFLLYAYLKPGTPEANRFGHAPADDLRGWEKFAGLIGVILVLLFTVLGIYGSLTDFGLIDSTLPF